MARLVLLLSIWFLATPAPAQAQSTHALFEASDLQLAELRILQAALTLTGDYNGLIDGDWGRISGQAMWRWAGRYGLTPPLRYGDLGPLLREFEVARMRDGWETLPLPEQGWSLALPMNVLFPTSEDDWINFASPDDRLRVSVDFRDPLPTRELHAALLDMRAAGTEPYQAQRAGYLITSVRLPDTGRLYLRSQWLGDVFVNVMIYAAAPGDRRLDLIAASIGTGPAPTMVLPADGVLARVFWGTVTPPGPPAAPAPVSPSVPAPVMPGGAADELPIGSGSGFFVNPSDLVTNAHVVDGCARLELGDGTVLQVIAVDPALDLAALSSDRRSPAWLTLGDAGPARLGEVAVALGYPLTVVLGDGLSVTLGNISALADPSGVLRFTAPVQPGNSGGPLLNRAGQVLGVVVARADESRYLEEFGTLPQNINFAIPVDALTGFLDRNLVVFPGRRIDSFNIDDGLPEAIIDAVVLVNCYR